LLLASFLLLGLLIPLLCALQVAAGSVQLHRSREEEGETLQLIHLNGLLS
jgi:hypothetical protein